MRDVACNDGNITRVEGLLHIHKFHGSAVRFTDADLKAVMKMQCTGWDVGNMPLFSG